MKKIDAFKGENHIYSNFYYAPVLVPFVKDVGSYLYLPPEDLIQQLDTIKSVTHDVGFSTVAEGIWFPTNEHAFQALKSAATSDWINIARLKTPGAAKRAGRMVVLRKDWVSGYEGSHQGYRDTVMLFLCLQKFMRHQELREKMLKDQEYYLEEGNNWSDTYWGVCRGKGANRLGHTLMEVRKRIENAANLKGA